jgi:hypothetical protein
MIDSMRIVQPMVRIETPMGAVESDSGSHILDGVTIIVIISVLYIIKKLVDKFIKKNGK